MYSENAIKQAFYINGIQQTGSTARMGVIPKRPGFHNPTIKVDQYFQTRSFSSFSALFLVQGK